MSDVTMKQGGRPAVHDVYALTRFSSRSENPLEEYALKRRVTRKMGSLSKDHEVKRKFTMMQEQDARVLVENIEIHEALSRLFNTVGHDDFVSRESRGMGSLFDRCFFCGSAFIEPVPLDRPKFTPGAAEVETTIYCGDAVDLTLHSVFRVDPPEPRRGP